MACGCRAELIPHFLAVVVNDWNAIADSYCFSANKIFYDRHLHPVLIYVAQTRGLGHPLGSFGIFEGSFGIFEGSFGPASSHQR